MEQTITFHVSEKDKELIFEMARKNRLSLSSFCRTRVLSSFESENKSYGIVEKKSNPANENYLFSGCESRRNIPLEY